MKENYRSKWKNLAWPAALFFPILLFGLILLVKIPYSLTQYFRSYSIGLFLAVLVLYYLSFRLPDRYRQLACLGLTLFLFALTLSYKWTSGYSDNKVIAGFLPYKDGAGYYLGAKLILSGMPLENTLQAGWRPLFPGFLASMLFLTGENLKLVLAILVLFAGMGSYFAVMQVFGSFGAFAAGLFGTLLYFFIQPLIGLTMTELLGFTMGCFAFSLLWLASFQPRWRDVLLGIVMLVLAMSVRAGTFFVLPLLALWAGRIFRGERSFSWRAFAVALTAVFLSYFLVNSLYVRLVGVPGGRVFGNFAYSLYGQVQGGTGWHRAIEELGTRDPAVIYQAAFQFFLKHPLSLLIGIVKSYRDFFLAGDRSIFPFDIYHELVWLNYLIWAGMILLTLWGVVFLIKNISKNWSLLLVAGLVGILLSIPFLPPIDGGSRFYASSIPFFFIVPVVGIAGLSGSYADDRDPALRSFEGGILRAGSIILSLLTVLTPLILVNTNSMASLPVPSCPPGEKPFLIRIDPGSYVDLVRDGSSCGLAPEICMGDFEKNGVEKSVDGFYQQLHSLAVEGQSDARILPAINYVDGRLRYFITSQTITPGDLPQGLLAGCAVENETENLTIYQVKSISSKEE